MNIIQRFTFQLERSKKVKEGLFMKGVKISRIMILLTIIGGIFLYACSGGGNPQAGKDGADAGQVLSGSIAEGDKCSADAECVDGLLCISDRCAKPGGVKEEGICTTDVECEDGLNCLNNICSKLSEDQVAPLDEDQVTPPDKWTLYVSKPINGLVTTDENDGINCGDVCSKSYDRNQAVKLLAEPAQGYVFDGWSGDCSGKDLAIEITMNSNKKCSASFSEVGITGYNLIIQKPNNGMVVSEPEGINCGSSEANCLKKFEVNAEIKLSAVPSDGYGFDGWSGDCSGGDFVIIKMDSEKTCSAKFSKLNPTNGFLTVQKIGKGIIKSSDGINCETEAICERAYEFKTNIKLTAAPAEGYKFDLWSGACTGTNSIVDITIEGPKTCTANFSKIQHQLIITKSEGGLVTSSPMGINCGALGEECSKLFDFGTEVVLSAVSDANYQFNGWLGDCSGVDIAIFTMNSEKTCSAKFSKKQSSVYTIAVQKVGKGKITSMDVLGKQVNCGDICTLSFDQETPITLFAWAENGYEFVSWSGDCSGSETEISLVLNSPKTCVATFKNIKYHLNIIKKEGGEIISDPSGINCGTMQTTVLNSIIQERKLF